MQGNARCVCKIHLSFFWHLSFFCWAPVNVFFSKTSASTLTMVDNTVISVAHQSLRFVLYPFFLSSEIPQGSHLEAGIYQNALDSLFHIGEPQRWKLLSQHAVKPIESGEGLRVLSSS